MRPALGLKRFLIVANPTSGRGRGRRTAEAVAEKLRGLDVEAQVRFTSSPGQADALARKACHTVPPPDCVVACGGDGTVQEVANALAALKATMGAACPALGLAPTGRCNDFARALGVHRDPECIASVLTGGVARETDLGCVNGRYFCTVATLGVDAEVSSFVDSMRLPLRGTPAYVYGALRVLARYRPQPLRIEGDFGVFERPVFLASSANTSFYGGNIRIAPHADPTDGFLDFCVIDPVSRLRAFGLLPTLLAGRHESLSIVHFHRTRRVAIDAPSPLEIWADGERIAQTPATIEVKPAAIRVVTPR